MDLSGLKVGDMVTAVNGYAIDPEPVIEIHPSGTRVRLTDSWGESQRWLYSDQHYVEIAGAPDALMTRTDEVEVELVLPAEAFVIISDSLLHMAEQIEANGGTAPQTRAVLKALHRFSTPSTNTQVVIRPKVG